MMSDDPDDHVLQPLPITVRMYVGTATLVQRPQLVWQHLYAAADFSRTVGEIEAENAGQPLGAFMDKIHVHALPCAIMAAAGVEAYANQIFADRATIFSSFDQALLESMWRKWAERMSALEKLQLAFQLRELPALNLGVAPAQNVAALFELRNALIHFKPEWSDARDEHEKLDKRLKAILARSQFYPEQEGLFPFAWATHANTKWAVTACVDLIALVNEALGLDAKLLERLKGLRL